MNRDKPSWYERARKGPFASDPFDERLRQAIKQKTAGKRDSGRRTSVAATWLVGAATVLLAVLIVARLQDAMPFKGPGGSQPIVSPGIGDIGNHVAVLRAEGTSEAGKLQVVAPNGEKQETLGAASCVGQETDFEFQGSYQVVYAKEGENGTVIAELPDLTFIQPSADTVRMTKLSFADADVFLLVPQYADCHGLSFYAYAVDKKNGEAFPLTFRMADGTESETSYYPPGQQPAIRDGQLVLPSSEGPGGETAEGPQDRIFDLNLAEKALVQTPAAKAGDAGGDSGTQALTRSFVFSGQTYTISYPNQDAEYYIYAAETDKGIVWAPAPPLGGVDQDLSIHPTEPYTLYLSEKKGGALTAENAVKLYTLPLKDGKSDVFLSGLYQAGDDIVYSTYSRQPGMNQPEREQLWALGLDAPTQARHLLDFHSSGGFLFEMGIEPQEGDVVTISKAPDGNDGYITDANLFRIKEGTKEKLTSYQEDEKGIRYEKNGKMYTAVSVQ
ncbi:hypothetical protein [Cohnella sp. REN36]|uniref:hypothetical protein n=1 Tax=Cohnella sp. REN36 TaxID=2887347 RepID=UPI001D1574C8|nr:hypothetical protein [Cohnella sp. REN36]MCC3373691.1 hypothetical protein [Cohnella sp. REN36]